MSYKTAMQAAIKDWSTPQHKITDVEVLREILGEADDEDVSSLAKASMTAGMEVNPEKHEAAVLEVGTILQGIIEKYLSEAFGAAWMDAEPRITLVNPDQERIDADNAERIRDINSSPTAIAARLNR